MKLLEAMINKLEIDLDVTSNAWYAWDHATNRIQLECSHTTIEQIRALLVNRYTLSNDGLILEFKPGRGEL